VERSEFYYNLLSKHFHQSSYRDGGKLLTAKQLAFLRYNFLIVKHTSLEKVFKEPGSTSSLSFSKPASRYDPDKKYGDIFYCLNQIPERFILDLLFKEKNIDRQRFDQELASRKRGFLDSCLQLFRKEEKLGKFVQNIFTFTNQVRVGSKLFDDITSSEENCLKFFVTKYLLDELKVKFKFRAYEDFNYFDSDDFLFSELFRLHINIDNNFVQSFHRVDNKESDLYRRLFLQFVKNPNGMTNRNHYLWKILVLDKIIFPHEFLHLCYESFQRYTNYESGDIERANLLKIINNLVALGGQRVIDKFYGFDNYCGEFKKYNFTEELNYHYRLTVEISNLILTPTNLPRDVCKLVATF
jgi:hypothetical protein